MSNKNFTKEEIKAMERYGITPKDVEKYVGEKSFRLALQALVAEINKKAAASHQHAATDIIEDNTHKFVTAEQIADWSTRAVVFEATKDALETADTDIMTNYFETNPTPAAKQGDVFVITTTVDEKDYEKATYVHDGSDWVAATGHVDASKVILRKDFTGAGNWTNIGNYEKGTIAGKGLSVEEFITNMVTKRLQPAVTAQPAVQNFSLNGAKAVEAGTKIETATFGTAKLTAGSYTYGPATGITAQSFKVDRVCDPAGLNASAIVNAASGTDNNGGQGFIIGDDTSVGQNVCTSLRYKVTVTHNEGVVAKDNLGSNSNPVVKIAAGEKVAQTAAYTPFRKFFYGTSPDKLEINSALVRGFTHSNAAYKAQTLTVKAKPGDNRVLIACIATAKGVTKVINKSSLNADITSAFTKSTVGVEGANGYKAVSYNVWTFEPKVPFEQEAILEITLG